MLTLRFELHDVAQVNQQWNNGLTHAGCPCVCSLVCLCLRMRVRSCLCSCDPLEKAWQPSDVFMREWQERVQWRTNFLLRWWSSTENGGSSFTRSKWAVVSNILISRCSGDSGSAEHGLSRFQNLVSQSFSPTFPFFLSHRGYSKDKGERCE